MANLGALGRSDQSIGCDRLLAEVRAKVGNKEIGCPKICSTDRFFGWKETLLTHSYL